MLYLDARTLVLRRVRQDELGGDMVEGQYSDART